GWRARSITPLPTARAMWNGLQRPVRIEAHHPLWVVAPAALTRALSARCLSVPAQNDRSACQLSLDEEASHRRLGDLRRTWFATEAPCEQPPRPGRGAPSSGRSFEAYAGVAGIGRPHH